MANLGLRISRVVLGVSVLALACVQCERDTQPFGEVTRKVDVTIPALGIEDIITVEPMGSRADVSDGSSSDASLFSVRLCSESEVSDSAPNELGSASDASDNSARAAYDGDSSSAETYFAASELGSSSETSSLNSLTRASVALNNVWVLQFDASGAAKTCAYVGSVAAGQSIKATLLSGSDYTLWVIANGPASGGLTTANVGSLSNFESALLCTLTPTADNLVPMSGKLSNVRILNNGQMLVNNNNAVVPEITLSRCMARIDLLLEYNVSGAALDGVWLYNVPVGASYGLDNSVESFPNSATASNFGFTDASAMNEGLVSKSSGSGTVTHTWYIGDNRRGQNTSIQWEKDKSSSKAPAMATFARIKSHETANVTQAMFHDVYLGDNVVADFNVLRNHQYIYNVRIGGTLAQQQLLATTDSRVSAGEYPNISNATISPDPTSGIAVGGATYTITLNGFWSGNIPIRAYDGSKEIVTNNVAYNSTNKNGSATLAVPANGTTSARTISLQYQWQGSWVTIKNGSQAACAIEVPGADYYLENPDPNITKNWGEAKSYCSGKGDGWRLPTSDELVYSVSVQNLIVASGGSSFYAGSFYWSSSDISGAYAWSVKILDGKAYSSKESLEYYVRCVKNK